MPEQIGSDAWIRFHKVKLFHELLGDDSMFSGIAVWHRRRREIMEELLSELEQRAFEGWPHA